MSDVARLVAGGDHDDVAFAGNHRAVTVARANTPTVGHVLNGMQVMHGELLFVVVCWAMSLLRSDESIR